MNEQLKNQITDFLVNDIPFNQLLGLEITRFDSELVEICFNWQDKLIGNPLQKILHGGVTAAAMDFAGGLIAAANIIAQLDDLSVPNILSNLTNLGTIDLRTDYLRPGRGQRFIVTARIIRSGNKVAVTRMEMHNEQDQHIACGTATYIVG